MHERKHTCFKLHGAQYCNTATFERSLAKVLLNTQLHVLVKDASFLEGDFLVQPTEASADLAKAFAHLGEKVVVASRCVHHEVRFASGDVVLYMGGAGSPCLAKAEIFIRVDTHFHTQLYLMLGLQFSVSPTMLGRLVQRWFR